jgi:hypothetical protein
MRRLLICLALVVTVALAQPEASLQESGAVHLDDAAALTLPNTAIEFMNSGYGFKTLYKIGDSFALKLLNLTASADVSLYSIHLGHPGAELFRNELINPDESGSASFRPGPLPRGEYILLAKDTKQSSVLAQLPLLVQDELTMNSPENLTAGQVLNVGLVRAGNPTNHAVGCLLLPERDYNKINVTIAESLIINKGNLSADIGGITSEQVMQILPLFPENCAIAMESEATSPSNLSLITEKGWERGDYMLLGASYSPQGISLAQKVVEIQ